MTAAEILKHIRRRIGEVGYVIGEDASAIYSDEYLLEYVDGAHIYLDAIDAMDDDYVVDVSGASITPEPSDYDGLLIALKASADLMAGDLTAKIREGALGVRFRTGVDEISTAEAGRIVAQLAQKHEKSFERLKTTKLAIIKSGTRIQ